MIPRTHERQVRGRLLERAAAVEGFDPRERLRFYGKRAAWSIAVRGTYLAKRLLDLTLAVALSTIAIPILAAVALAIRLESPGPVLVCERRLGRWGRLFNLWRFRIRFEGAAPSSGEPENPGGGPGVERGRHDPGLTKVGRFVRETSVDRLLELWNLFLGDLSLLGPRPLVPADVDPYSLEDRGQLAVKPGMVAFRPLSDRPESPSDHDLDLRYLESRLIAADAKILSKAVAALLIGTAAY